MKKMRVVVSVICIIALATSVCLAAGWTHSVAPYSQYQTNILTIAGEGVDQEISFTVAELEAMTEKEITAVYTLRTSETVTSSEYKGISIAYLIEQAKPNSKANYINVIASDGFRATFTYDELVNMTYQNEKGEKGLVPIIAYAINGFPMVSDKNSTGYDAASKNGGGPLRMVVGQMFDQQINSSKFVKSITRIEIVEDGTRTDFGDLSGEYAWAQNAIYALYDKGIVNGVSNNTFAPGQTVKRSEYSKMITMALSIEPEGTAAIEFKDVSQNYWGAPYIQAAVDSSLMKGVSATEFNPEGNITRNEIAVLAVRAMELESEATGLDGSNLIFTDKNEIPDWAVGSVVVAAEQGLFNNIAFESFEGNKAVTRAEAAVITEKVMHYLSMRP